MGSVSCASDGERGPEGGSAPSSVVVVCMRRESAAGRSNDGWELLWQDQKKQQARRCRRKDGKLGVWAGCLLLVGPVGPTGRRKEGLEQPGRMRKSIDRARPGETKKRW